MFPDLRNEKKLWKKGYKRIVGLDEAGRGPLAGPVTAAAVMIKPIGGKFLKIRGIKDSKKLSAKKREGLYKILTNYPQIEWGIGRVSEKAIDKINILEATKLAMKRAVRNLEKKLQRSDLCNSDSEKKKTKRKTKRKPVPYLRDRANKRQRLETVDFLILDGSFRIDYSHGPIRISRGRAKRGRGLGYSHTIPQKSIKRADEKVFSCSCASIIAKVYRDRIMQRFHKKYPQYDFDRHKGYPTKYHFKMLKKYGPCKIHRKSFRPVTKLLNG